MKQSPMTRRRFVRATGAVAVAVPLASLLATRPSLAQDKLSEDDATAQALGYVHDASTSDNAARQEGAICANCSLYAKDQEQDGWAPCSIFPGKLVNGEGWCTVWQQAQG